MREENGLLIPLQIEHFRPGLRIPETHGPVLTARFRHERVKEGIAAAGHDPDAIRTEYGHIDVIGMALENSQFRSRSGVPDPGGLIAAVRENVQAVRAECDAADTLRLSAEGGDAVTRLNVPNFRRRIRATVTSKVPSRLKATEWMLFV